MLDLREEVKEFEPVDLSTLSSSDLLYTESMRIAYTLYNKALQEIEEGYRDLAKNNLKKAVSYYPEFSEAALVLGICTFINGDRIGAVRIFNSVKKPEDRTRGLKILDRLAAADNGRVTGDQGESSGAGAAGESGVPDSGRISTRVARPIDTDDDDNEIQVAPQSWQRGANVRPVKTPEPPKPIRRVSQTEREEQVEREQRAARMQQSSPRRLEIEARANEDVARQDGAPAGYTRVNGVRSEYAARSAARADAARMDSREDTGRGDTGRGEVTRGDNSRVGALRAEGTRSARVRAEDEREPVRGEGDRYVRARDSQSRYTQEPARREAQDAPAQGSIFAGNRFMTMIFIVLAVFTVIASAAWMHTNARNRALRNQLSDAPAASPTAPAASELPENGTADPVETADPFASETPETGDPEGSDDTAGSENPDGDAGAAPEVAG